MRRETSPFGGKKDMRGAPVLMAALAALTIGSTANADRAEAFDQVVPFEFDQNNILLVGLDPFDMPGHELTGVRFALDVSVDLDATLSGEAEGVDADPSLLVYEGVWIDWVGTTMPVAVAIDTEATLACDGPLPAGATCGLGAVQFDGSVEGALPASSLDHFRTDESVDVALVGLATLFSSQEHVVAEHRVTGTLTVTYEFEALPSCPADVDGSGTVGIVDLVAVLSAWGHCPGCPADVTRDGTVRFDDLTAVLDAWGGCP